ncbi:MAG: YggS family pyridoxal phosphate-dependent enzyme, partial [Armatimonadetes bacterium]|nr:YggS family pyridoxal phosphate-dependent enzyme [Armatimonadota bacterium]
GAGAATWHLVGHLQRNKAKAAAQIFDVVHSVDSAPLAEDLARRAAAAGRTLDVLIEVNIGGEPQKFGVLPEDTADLVAAVSRLDGIRLCGLMAIPPMGTTAEEARPFFQALRVLRDDAVARGAVREMPELSMGMTDDFEVAIEEGATIVRVGRAIFGERPAPR